MTCAEFKESIPEILEENLGDDHARTCRACDSELEKARRLVKTLKTFPSRAPVQSRVRPVLGMVGVAAAAAVALFILFMPSYEDRPILPGDVTNSSWIDAWTKSTRRLVEGKIAVEKCPACGRAKPWKLSEAIDPAATADPIPDMKFFVLIWSCCSNGTPKPRILGVGKKPGLWLDINQPASWGSLIPHIRVPQSNDHDDEFKICAAVFYLCSRRQSKTISRKEAEEFEVAMNTDDAPMTFLRGDCRVQFDKDRRLESIQGP
jgi:hypothetical protein